jgi:hypothetical protein
VLVCLLEADVTEYVPDAVETVFDILLLPSHSCEEFDSGEERGYAIIFIYFCAKKGV